MEQLLIGLVSGAVGGNAAGMASEKLNQGTLVNSIAGIVGGGLGSSVLSNIMSPDTLAGLAETGGFDLGAIATDVAGGGIGGAAVLALISVAKRVLGGQQ